MRMEVSQQLRPELQLRLSPKMIQSMEILQLPMMALQERIQQELEKNPVLEQESASDEAPRLRPIEPLRNADPEKRTDFSKIDGLSSDWNEHFNQSSWSSRRGETGERDRKMDAMANTAARGPGLQESLLEQVAFFDTDADLRTLAEAIISNLEDSGYLRIPVEDAVAGAGVEATPERIQAALELVQRLDPAGVGARNLPECLTLQIRRMEGDHSIAIDLISRHLDDLVNNRYPAIVRKTGYTIPQIEEAMRFLRTLQPRPGSLVGDQPVPYVNPDLVIEFDENSGELAVRLADDKFPNLQISGDYKKMLKEGGADAKAKEFLQTNIRSAHWLINSIEQRRHTLMRVARKAVEHQAEFVLKGAAALKPLPMTQVADELGIHVGTVSRAVSEKYCSTPRGTIPLRAFFTGGTQSADGEDIAWDAVRAKLVDIIAAEDKTDPLSDGDIVKKLKAQGIDVARRTVAKYRKILNINSARKRRQYRQESLEVLRSPEPDLRDGSMDEPDEDDDSPEPVDPYPLDSHPLGPPPLDALEGAGQSVGGDMTES